MSGHAALTELSEALAIVWRAYELGWVQDQPSTEHFAEFGTDIETLAQNLNNVIRIIENARSVYQQHAIRSPMFRGFYTQKDWDLSSLHEIAGDFRKTITECEELLGQNRDVYRNKASMYNDEFTVVFQPKIADLQKRVRAHNSKFAVLLRPLEASLLSDIRHEFVHQSNRHERGQRLQAPLLSGLMVFDIDQTVAEYKLQPMSLDLAPELEASVSKTVAEPLRPELQRPGTLPLGSGVESFFSIFEQSTKTFSAGDFVNERTPSATQYINLIASVVILKGLQESEELRQANPASLWHFFISELASVLRSECQRFTGPSAKYLIAPDVSSLERELARRGHDEGTKSQVIKLMSPYFKTYTEEILRLPLPSVQDTLRRQIVVFRVDASKLQLVESISRNDAPANSLEDIVLDIDLKRVQLTPLYATPSSRPKPLELLLHTGVSQLNPTFLEAKHIYRLQHLLTGYKVYDRWDQAMVRVTFTVAGQSLPLEEHGRVQLWLPQPYTAGNKATNPTDISSHKQRASSRQSLATNNESPALASSPPAKRTSSIRKWIPGFRRNSDGDNTSSKVLANEQNRSNATLTQATLQQAPIMAQQQTIMPGTDLEGARHNGMPGYVGPFELSAASSGPYTSTNMGGSVYTMGSNLDSASAGNIPFSPLPCHTTSHHPTAPQIYEHGRQSSVSSYQAPAQPAFENNNSSNLYGGGPMDPVWSAPPPSPRLGSPDHFHPATGPQHPSSPERYNSITPGIYAPNVYHSGTRQRGAVNQYGLAVPQRRPANQHSPTAPGPRTPEQCEPTGAQLRLPDQYNQLGPDSSNADHYTPAALRFGQEYYNRPVPQARSPGHYNSARAQSGSPDHYGAAADQPRNHYNQPAVQSGSLYGQTQDARRVGDTSRSDRPAASRTNLDSHGQAAFYNMSPAHPSHPNPNLSPTYPMSPTDSTYALNSNANSSCTSSTTSISNYGSNLGSRSLRPSPSVISTRSTRSQSSLAPTVSTIRTSTGPSSSGVARMHHKPQKPLLVLFLKSRDPAAQLSIVAIQIDTHTSVKRERCDCYNSHSTCRISCLEREKGGSLLAQRWDADAGLNSWNLAKVGESQRKEGENIWPNLRRVSMKFEKMEDRYKFAGSPCSCKVHTRHELSNCNLNSHNGLFGIVKQIGEQVLLNYHNERNSAMAKTMVMSTLPEDEA